jgi:beta-galactosidase
VDDAVVFGTRTVRATRWREDLRCDAATAVLASYANGAPAVTQHDRVRYVAGWLDADGWRLVLDAAARGAGLAPKPLPEGVRVSRLGALTIACNFSNTAVPWAPSSSADCLLGSRELPPRGVSIWKAVASS